MRAPLSSSRLAALVTAALAFGCQKSGPGLSAGNGAGSTGTGSEGSASGSDQGSAAPIDNGSGSQAVNIPPAGGDHMGGGSGSAAPAPEAKDIDSKDILARANPADEAYRSSTC